jgi:hypothetical protein
MARHNLPRTKTPTEKFRFTMDFKNDVKSGDTASAHSVTAKRLDTGADATTEMISAVVRLLNVVETSVQAGTDGVDYEVKFALDTTQGDHFEAYVIVPVRS